MDAFLFRGSQKLEQLQYQAGVAATEGKLVFQQISSDAKHAVISAWTNPKSVQVQEAVREFFFHFWTVLDELRCSVLYHINPRPVLHAIEGILGSHWTRRDLFFGGAGVLIGCVCSVTYCTAFHRRTLIVQQMLAVQCTSYTGIESTTATDEALTRTSVKDDEVLINVKAGSVHLIDAAICSGYGRTLRSLLCQQQYSKNDLPLTLGRDCTGIVLDVGKNVKRFDIGDEVWTTAPFWAQGTLCQYLVINELHVGLKPSALGYEGASSLPYSGGLALSVLHSLPNCLQNKRIFIQGCCTPVGCIMVQLLKIQQAHITATCFKRALPVAEALKCDDIIELTPNDDDDNDNNNAAALLKELRARDPFDIIINTRLCGVDDVQFQEFCPRGEYKSTVLHQPRIEDSYVFPISTMFGMYIKAKCFYRMLFGKHVRDFGEAHICHNTLDELKKLVDDGKLKTLVDKVYYPTDIESALHHIQSAESIGSTVITFR